MKLCAWPASKLLTVGCILAAVVFLSASGSTVWAAERVVLGEYFTWLG